MVDLGLVDRGAELSSDGLYRYLLWRIWGDRDRCALFIMLNPSTADAEIDDPTIRRCIGFARSWGLDGIRVANLYPFRATKPADLWRAANPRGQGNSGWIEKGVDRKGIAVAAWGAHARPEDARATRNIFYDLGVPLYALGLTQAGQPKHPLYLAGDTVPTVYEPARNPLRVGDAWARSPTAIEQRGEG